MDLLRLLKETLARDAAPPRAGRGAAWPYPQAAGTPVRNNPDGSRDLVDLAAAICWQTEAAGRWRMKSAALSGSAPVSECIPFQQPFYTPPHRHNYLELAYVAEGRLCQRIEERDEQFEPGEICLIDCDSQHTDLVAPEACTVLFLAVDKSLFDRLWPPQQGGSETERFLHEVILQRRETYRFVRFTPRGGAVQAPGLLAHILDELLRPRPGGASLVKGYVERLLSTLPAEYLISLSRREQGQFNRRLANDVCAYIRRHLADVSAEGLARRFHYNPDYFSRLLQKHTGLSFVQYLQKARMDRACLLLKTTALPVAEIARQVGYTNQSFFYKKFQAQYGCTPGEMREG